MITKKCKRCSNVLLSEKRTFCSRDCANIFNAPIQAESKKGDKCYMYGKKPWNYGKKLTEKQRKKWNKNIKNTEWGKHGFKKGNKTKSQFKKGKRHPYYIDDRKSLIYPSIYLNKARDEVKKRDNYICQNPNKHECNDVIGTHHIDYNKQNNKSSNLICLCNKHNIQANFDKKYYYKFYKKIIKNKYNY